MSATEPTDNGPDEEHGSWDAFWDEVLRKSPIATIRGVQVRTPADLPLSFDQELARARDADDEDTYRELLKKLFGVDVLDAWVQAGMGKLEFKVVMAWGLACGRGKPITFREAYERVHALESGKAPAAEETTNSTRMSEESDATGERSKPTSTANMASTRKGSPRSRGASSGSGSPTSPPTASTG